MSEPLLEITGEVDVADMAGMSVDEMETVVRLALYIYIIVRQRLR